MQQGDKHQEGQALAENAAVYWVKTWNSWSQMAKPNGFVSQHSPKANGESSFSNQMAIIIYNWRYIPHFRTHPNDDSSRKQVHARTYYY